MNIDTTMSQTHFSKNSYAGELTARDAYNLLERDPNAVLVDVRTLPEWTFVGYPNLSILSKEVIKLSWKVYPTMQLNTEFISQLSQLVPDKQKPLLFLCRSGGRSQEAAIAMSAVGYSACYNVSDGFEGPLSPLNQRGTSRGWKAENLPWEQQ